MNTIIKNPIPAKITSEYVLHIINNKEIDSSYYNLLKELMNFNDEMISYFLNINKKTYRHYYKNKVVYITPDKQEYVILLLSLVQRGKDIFGSNKKFSKWLTYENFQLGKQPIQYLNTISGIKLINNRLTGIEYGDNI